MMITSVTLRHALLLSTICWSSVCGQTLDDQQTDRLRVLTYNIHHGRGVDGELDLPRIANVIRTVNPDIVALQEVDQNVLRSESIDQPKVLAELTGMHVVFGGNIPLQGGKYGNAILSKLPIVVHRNHLLPNIDSGEQRGVLVSQLRHGRYFVSVLATHFDHRRDNRERLASVDAINNLAAKLEPGPAIMLGDINATRDGEVLQRLSEVWSIAGDREQPTIPVANPDRQIDFVLTRPKHRWHVVKTKIIDEPVASDHRPLLAVFHVANTDARSVQLQGADILQTLDESGNNVSATTDEQWKSRRKAILRSMQSVMGWLPTLSDRVPPTVNVIDQVDCGSYVRKKISYRSQLGCDTPAYLCVPKGIADGMRVPAVLCLHPTDNKVGHDVVVGLGGKPNRQYAAELAKRGYVTLAPSYPLLANYQPDLTSLGWESGTLKAIWDNIRGVDLLQSLPQVNGQQIGAIGHSLGGHNSIFTAVFDQRIKAIVTSCGFDSFQDYYDGNPEVWKLEKGWCQTRYMPRLANYAGRLDEIPFDFDELLASIAPRHVLVVAPLHDSNFRSASVDRIVAQAGKAFSLHGHLDRLRVVHPDCEHDFPAEMRSQAYRLFDRVLRGKTDSD